MPDIVTIHTWRRMAVDRPRIPHNKRHLNWYLVSARSSGPVSSFKTFIFEAIEVHEVHAAHEVDEYNNEWLLSMGAI